MKEQIENFVSSFDLEKWITIGIKMACVYLIMMAFIYIERRLFKRVLHKRDKESADKTNLIFLKNVVVYTTYLIGFVSLIYQVPGLQKLSNTVLAGAGILAAAVGFGSQQAISNIVSGIFMVLFKPFRIGDFINIGNQYIGTVVDISLRHTTIKNSENRMIIVPNNVLNNQSIINSSILNADTCALIEVGIGYSADINKAIFIIQDEATKHPLLIDTRTEEQKNDGTPLVIVRVIEWAASSVNLRAWAWAASTGDAFVLKCDLLKSVKERFDRENIEIPFTYTNVILKKE